MFGAGVVSIGFGWTALFSLHNFAAGNSAQKLWPFGRKR